MSGYMRWLCTLLIALAACDVTVATETQAAPAALQLQPDEWVLVSRCRLQCVSKFLLAAGRLATEEVCMSDAEGCLDCWKWCENVRSRPTQFLCPGAEESSAASARIYPCTSVGCNAACSMHPTLDKRFYAPGASAGEGSLVPRPLLDFHNSTLVYITTPDVGVAMATDPAVAMFVILYRLGPQEPWVQLLSTFQQPIPVFGSFHKYPSLQLRLLVIGASGVVGDRAINIHQLASEVANAPRTTTFSYNAAPTQAPAKASSTPSSVSVHNAPTTTAIPEAYLRIFNHLFNEQIYNLLGNREGANATVPRSSAPSEQSASLAMYITVAVVCILLVAVIIVGVVILRSNQQLAKSLSRRAHTFRQSLHRSVRRSVRGLRKRTGYRGNGFYDVERATHVTASAVDGSLEVGDNEAGDDSGHGASKDTSMTEMRPMVVPLLCVSTPNLNHAVNRLSVSPIRLHARSLNSLATAEGAQGEAKEGENEAKGGENEAKGGVDEAKRGENEAKRGENGAKECENGSDVTQTSPACNDVIETAVPQDTTPLNENESIP